METKPVTRIEANVLPVAKIQVTDGGGAQVEYSLVLDYNAIAKAQEVLGRDLSVLLNWQKLSGPDLSVIAWAAFDRYHPEVTLRQVRQWLAPAQQNDLFSMLFEMTWPGIMADLVRFAEDQAAVPSGEGQPNPPAAAGA
jgi:hypothetical protein